MVVSIEFTASHGPTVGVEWELQLIDAATRHLRQQAGDVLAALPELSGDAQRPKLRHELMESQLELVTDPCDTVQDAKTDLAATLAELTPVLEPSGLRVACAGTHPVSDWRDAVFTPGERYAELIEQLQWLVRRIQTFSVQVHVGVRSRDKVMPVVNALAAYLPHFLALTASSPFWSAHDTGLSSARSIVFGALPTAGPPHMLADWAEFEEYMDTLLRAGTVRSIKEVWWDVRPHPDIGTVEVRGFDGVPTLRELGMATALAQCLVQRLDTQVDRGYRLPRPPAWIVRDNKWRATRYGLDAVIITDDKGSTVRLRDELYELLRELGPTAERLGCADELGVASEVLERGASYERQRAILERGGSLTDVVDALVAELRTDEIGVTAKPGRRRTRSGIRDE